MKVKTIQISLQFHNFKMNYMKTYNHLFQRLNNISNTKNLLKTLLSANIKVIYTQSRKLKS